MARHSKRYREIRKGLEVGREYGIGEAIELIRGQAGAKFEESLEISVKLGINPKQSDQAVRGTVSLPKGTGRDVRVIAFAEGDAAQAAKDAGAVDAGGAELVERVQGGWTDFDIAVATPAMMRQVGRLGRILGPQGKMPSPKSGTVTDDVASAVSEFKGGRIEYRNDDTGNLHAPMGKMSFPIEDLQENVEAFISHIASVRPAAAKGRFIVRAFLSRTMGPAVRIAV